MLTTFSTTPSQSPSAPLNQNIEEVSERSLIIQTPETLIATSPFRPPHRTILGRDSIRLKTSYIENKRVLRVHGEKLNDEVAAILNEWLSRRPAVIGESRLDAGGYLFNYKAQIDQPNAPRYEAFYTAIPGLALAAFVVHPDLTQSRSMPHPPNLQHVVHRLSEPPISLLTGIWQDNYGNTYTERGFQIYKADRQSIWRKVAIPHPADEVVRMLGRQADGCVYFHTASRIWKAKGSSALPIDLPRSSLIGKKHVDASGQIWLLHDQMLHSGHDMQPGRSIVLLRCNHNETGFERSPAQVKDCLPLPSGEGILFLDDKGRVYESQLDGKETIEARRLSLTIPPGHGDNWAVTQMGLARDDSVHLLLQDRNGRQMSVYSEQDRLNFQPGFLLDRPLLLMHKQGIQSPPPEEIESVLVLDGHTQIGHLHGVLQYCVDPSLPWEPLTTHTGDPVTGVQSLKMNPSGFIDRRGVFALLNETEIFEFKFTGRTSWFPADDCLPRYPIGGPLAVVPSRVQLRTRLLARFETPIQSFEIFADRSCVALTQNKVLQLAAPGKPFQNILGIEQPIAMAIGLDDRLVVLHRSSERGLAFAALNRKNSRWHALQVRWSNSAQPNDLRTTRSGQIQVKMNETWHLLLPAMTVSDGSLAAMRILDIEANDEKPTSSPLSGTNAIINQRQSSRLSTPHHDLSISTTLLGTSSTDPLTLTSQLRTIKETTFEHARIIARDILGAAAAHSIRSVGKKLGIPFPHTSQNVRLMPLHTEARRAYESGLELCSNLPITALAKVTTAVGPRNAACVGFSDEVVQQLVSARENILSDLLHNLQKISYTEGILQGDLGLANADGVLSDTTSTTGFMLAEKWRRLNTRAHLLLGKMCFRRSDDILPSLADGLQALNQAACCELANVSEHEKSLFAELAQLSKIMCKSGLHLIADDGLSAHRAHSRHGLRTAALLSLLIQYDQLLTKTEASAVHQALESQHTQRLLGVAKLGITSWNQLEAFDEIVTTFRQDMANKHSPRRLQLLKSMGLSPDAELDEMAARMADVLQDLFNRSTYFSIKVSSGELRGSLSSEQLTQITALSIALTGDSIHALGVERIGDSKDADAGLVAFFVRHKKRGLSATSGLGIDFKPGTGTGTYIYSDNPGNSVSAAWGGAALTTLTGAYQHGEGAAVILSPPIIPEFARLLFDLHDTDTTNILRSGVNGGSIGLDLFESNVNTWGGLNINSLPLSYNHLFGKSRPADPTTANSASRVNNGCNTLSALASAATSTQLGVHWAQMELHLDHAWRKMIGLEYQGRLSFNAEFNNTINVGSGLARAVGDTFGHLINLATGNGNLQLAGIRIGSTDIQLPLDAFRPDKTTKPFYGSGSYKRTLDTELATSISEQEWQEMVSQLHSLCPESRLVAELLSHPKLSSERIAILEMLIDRLQGGLARGVETFGALEGIALRRQRIAARQATNSVEASLWHVPSEIARSTLLDRLHFLRQTELRAAQQRAQIIPGGRIEFNLFGRESLEAVVLHAIGHLGLGSRLADIEKVRQNIPGLDRVFRCFQHLPNINQVRYVCEMRPQARIAINDALILREQQMASGRSPSSNDGSMDWRSVLDKARSSPDLYRLAAIIVHNTDENPSTQRIGLPFLGMASIGSTAHQLFLAEIQFNYGMYDELQGAEVLEAGSRAMLQPLHVLHRSHIEPIQPSTSPGDISYDPPSPRA